MTLVSGVFVAILVVVGIGMMAARTATSKQLETRPVRRPTGELTVQMAQRLRLRIDSKQHLVGRKRRMEVRLIENVGSWHVSVSPSCLMPVNTHMRCEVDGEAVRWDYLDGPRTDLVWLMQDEQVVEASRRLASRGFDVQVRGSDVVMYSESRNIDAALEGALDLAAAIAARRLQSVRALVDRLEVDADRFVRPDRLDGPGLIRLVADVDDRPIEIVMPWLDRGVWRASVKATLCTPLPPGTYMAGVTEEGEPSVELGDLIVDSSPVVVQTSDPAALRERICTDGVRGPLLDAICANVGSQVTATCIQVEIAEGALDIDGAVSNVLDLIEGLG